MISFKNKAELIQLIILIGISLFAYYQIAFEVQQRDFQQLILNYSLAFISFVALYIKFKTQHKLLLTLSILFRLMFFLASPQLSQDIYRYIWDGHLIINGFNPYEFTPDQLMQQAQLPFALADELYPQLTELSAAHHSNYPPMSQFFYAVSAMISSEAIYGSILFLKAVLFSADVLVYKLALPILQHLKLARNQVYLYLLNPLLIVEGMGNLHFEPLMATFLLTAIFFWLKQKKIWTGVFMGLAIATKLLPLLLLPFLAKGTKKFQFRTFLKSDFLWIILIALLVTTIGFTAFINLSTLSSYLETISLWFNTFEFNASIYYLFRWMGFQISGWNMIAIFGKALTAVSLILLIFLAVRSTASRKMQLESMVWVLIVYFLLATTIHPWYLIIPLTLSIFSKYKLPILTWTFTIFFSYHAYQGNEFQEINFWLIAEYIPVFAAILFSFKNYFIFLKPK